VNLCGFRSEEEEEEWAGAWGLVNSSRQPTYVALEGNCFSNPSALHAPFLPATPAGRSFPKETGEPREFPFLQFPGAADSDLNRVRGHVHNRDRHQVLCKLGQ